MVKKAIWTRKCISDSSSSHQAKKGGLLSPTEPKKLQRIGTELIGGSCGEGADSALEEGRVGKVWFVAGDLMLVRALSDSGRG